MPQPASTVATYSGEQIVALPNVPSGHEGAMLADTYCVGRLIGIGGMSVVHEATHLRLGHKVAIKFLDSGYGNHDVAYARFRREAEIASSIGHDNIAKVTDFNTLADGTPYMVMELLEGEDLAHRLLRGPLALGEVIAMSEQIASALAAAHKHGVVHRDLKPDNVFLCAHDGAIAIKVLDFGISKIRGALKTLTKDAQLMGTPSYMSPEQARGDKARIDHRSDVYSFGAVLYEALCGKPAYDGDNVYEILTRVALTRPPALPGFAPEVDAVIQRAMARDPADRYPTVGALHRALVLALTGRELRPPSQSEEIVAWTDADDDARDGDDDGDAAEPAAPLAIDPAVIAAAVAIAPTRLADTIPPRWSRRQLAMMIGLSAAIAAAVIAAAAIVVTNSGATASAAAATAPAPTSTPAPTSEPALTPEPALTEPAAAATTVVQAPVPVPTRAQSAPSRSRPKAKPRTKPALVHGSEL